VPLASRGEPFGTLLLARARGGQPFDEGEVALVREALSNVHRHAGAATCRVSLHRDEGGAAALLEVDDDGRGFDVAAGSGAGRGLGNLRGRAARLGGRAEIVSVPGEGTTVRVAIPVEWSGDG
jgi:signal transduction histidine kinase